MTAGLPGIQLFPMYTNHNLTMPITGVVSPIGEIYGCLKNFIRSVCARQFVTGNKSAVNHRAKLDGPCSIRNRIHITYNSKSDIVFICLREVKQKVHFIILHILVRRHRQPIRRARIPIYLIGVQGLYVRYVFSSRNRPYTVRKLLKCRNIRFFGNRSALVADRGFHQCFAVSDRRKILLQFGDCII